MPVNLNNIFGVHEQALLVRAKKAELIANNIANADTPGYKARDIDFRDVLKNAETNTGQLRQTNSNHISQSPLPMQMDMKYRIPVSASMDGNSVDTQLETAAFSDNALRYQATLQFISGRMKSLMTALKGE